MTLAVAAFLLGAATAQAQTEGDVRSRVEPATLTVDFDKHAPRPGGEEPVRQTFRIFVEGTIDCIPGTGAPVAVVVEANGTTAWRGQSGGEPVQYFELGREATAFTWQSEGGGSYSIDAAVDVTVYSNATPPQKLDARISWPGASGEPEGTPRCDPSGYAWVVQDTPHTIVVPGPGDGDPDPFPDPAGSNGTPMGLLLPLSAVGAALALRRRTG